ncbi:Rv2231c family pyridoxal phosphate-dependent protein CobC [Nocardioides hwasunensis]|uniref:Aminotransferase n=1 Tax=Nocardioides hwasunensis TaxID=397258 RepID=A0ABR8MLS2_9ACTN|nr:Rv2231c family pyridoxal phosphate-dependent protein CobC [Nocardioides hwasunensis]MBD3916510.1 threonine-phosphate decarboxylase [Nocardioides hwasunensis]
MNLRHHGDREATPGLVDFAVNVHPAPMPSWLREAITRSVDDLARYPDPTEAEAALATHHHRERDDVLATSGAAEAFTLIARLTAWRRPVVVHPQFTEPDVALENAGHAVDHVVVGSPRRGGLPDFGLETTAIPDDADLVVVGNPTNPTGVRHRAAALQELTGEGRLVVVDEAFNDNGAESLADERIPGLLVVRSLTKLWAIAGLRAGYVLGEPDTVARLRELQPPWSVSTPAAAAMIACTSDQARAEASARDEQVTRWREHLEQGLRDAGIEHVPSSAPFVLARPGAGVHAALRARGVAVRRCDTFPGLDDSWVRIAVRPPEVTRILLDLLSAPA